MFLRAIFSRAAFERFVATLRQEGLGAALGKTRDYLSRLIPTVRRGHDAAYLDDFWQDMARREAFHVGAAPAHLTNRRRVAMIGDLYLPQCRKYRVAQMAELWGRADAEYSFAAYNDVPRAVSLLQNATHLMFYRTLNDPRMAMYLYEARRLRLPVLYDLDDPLFSVSAYETYENMKAVPKRLKAHFLREAPRYLGAMNLADMITVSTPAMVEHTRLYTGRPVHFRRNFADRETLEAARIALGVAGRRAGAPFRVVFASGSMGHEVDFGLIAGEMAAFLDAAPDRQLVILGHFNLELLPERLRARVEAHAFSSYERYLEVLSTADCAVMPLTDDVFNRCKSAVRVIDAAAVAVPSLVGDVSDMKEVVRDGTTGRVLGQGASWRDALEEMARDRAGTAAMGAAARADLSERWTAQAGLPIVEPQVLDWLKG